MRIKITAFTLMVGLIAMVGFAGDPCCAVLSFNAAKGQALIRDIKTGRTFLAKGTQFRAGAALAALPAGLFEPAYGEPCCEVASVQKIGQGALVSATHKTSGKTIWFEVNSASVVEALKIGQPVNVVGNFALFSVPGSPARQLSNVRTLSGAPSTRAFFSFRLK